MYRIGLVAVTVLAGCDGVFGLGDPTDAGALTPGDGGVADGGVTDGGATDDGGARPVMCIRDDFSGALGNWATGFTSPCTQALCTLQITSGALVATFGAAGGLTSTLNPAVDFTGGAVEIEAIPGATTATASQLRVAMSNSEILGIGLTADATGAMSLVAVRTSAGSTDKLLLATYDPIAHRHWRIEHALTVTGADLVISTRATATPTWTELARVAAPPDVSTTFAQLDIQRSSAMASNDLSASVISFDTFALCTQ